MDARIPKIFARPHLCFHWIDSNLQSFLVFYSCKKKTVLLEFAPAEWSVVFLWDNKLHCQLQTWSLKKTWTWWQQQKKKRSRSLLENCSNDESEDRDQHLHGSCKGCTGKDEAGVQKNLVQVHPASTNFMGAELEIPKVKHRRHKPRDHKENSFCCKPDLIDFGDGFLFDRWWPSA